MNWHRRLSSAFVLSMAMGGWATPAVSQTTHIVQAIGESFVPQDITITVGDSVKWINLFGLLHNVAEVDCPANLGSVYNGGYYSGPPGLVDEFTVTFNSIGSSCYICEVHLGFSMWGSVTVIPECGQVYCDVNPDNAADISADTCSCADGSINISMSSGPPGNAGYLLVGESNGSVTDPPGAQGDLCLIGGPIGRYVKDVGVIDAGGNLSTDVLNAITGGGGGNIPSPPGGNLCVPPGQTWNFQYWHRDGLNPSRFSKAIAVTFQ